VKIRYLDLEDLLGLVRALGAGPVRDLGLLDSSAARAHTRVFAADAYPSLELKAAALLDSLARSEALAGENNPLAWLATAVFLDLNNAASTLQDKEACLLVKDVAAGPLDVRLIAERLCVVLLAEA
jgi:death on curing protein